MLIAKYKYDRSIYENLIPEFNAGFTNYEIVDEYLDTEDIITTNTKITLLRDYSAEPDEYGVLTTEYEVETTSEFKAENIVTRSIYSNKLPTLMRFGANNTGEWTDTDARANSLLSVLYLNANLTTMRCMFTCCTNLREITCDIDTSNVTDMYCVFYCCYSLTALDVSNWDTSKVTDMYCMFGECYRIPVLDVSNWDTSKVTNMNSMFFYCQSLYSIGDVSRWDTSNVTDMDSMFRNCEKLTSLDVSNFDTSNVTNMYAMFYSCNSLTSLDVSNWDTSNVTDMGYMFACCNLLTTVGDLSNWNVSNVTNMSYMFGASDDSFGELISIPGLSKWNTSNVTDMSCMFYKQQKLTSLDVSNFDTSNVIDMDCMFYVCRDLKSLDVSNWDVSNVTDMSHMFRECYDLTSLDLSNWDTSKVTNMKSMFNSCHDLTSLNVSNWDTSNVTDMICLFDSCYSLTSLDVSNWDTSKLSNTSCMFNCCSSLKSVIGLSNWDTSSVYSTDWMFANCHSLISLDLSNWNLIPDIYLEGMFYCCCKLTNIKLSGWVITDEAYTDMLFLYCDSLINVTMNDSDYHSVNKIIDILPNSNGILTIVGVDDLSQVNISTAQSKGWTIIDKYLVAKYKFDESIYENLIPIFNEEFTNYEIVDNELDIIDFKNNLAFGNTTHEPGRKLFYRPIYLDNGDIEFTCSDWDIVYIDTSEYIGKTVNISFTITNKLGWCELGIENGISYETIISDWYESEIESLNYSKSVEVLGSYINLQGMYCILSDISITVEDNELFPAKIMENHHLRYDSGFYGHMPEMIGTNGLEFTHNWNGIYIDMKEYKGLDVNLSFDAIGLSNDKYWTEFEYEQFDGYKTYHTGIEGSYHIICDELSEEVTVHCESTFTMYKDYLYIGGMGGRISNLRIEVINNGKINLEKNKVLNTGLFPEPFERPNGTLRFDRSWWDFYTIDVSEYIGKTMQVSFRVESYDDGTWVHWLEGYSTGYSNPIIYEDCTQYVYYDINYSFEITNEQFTLQGCNIKMSNIQLLVDGINIYELLPGFNGYSYSVDFDKNKNYKFALKDSDGNLNFTKSEWNVISYDLSKYIGNEITISFDVNTNQDDFYWAEIYWYILPHNDYSNNESLLCETVICETPTESKTIHFERTFTLECSTNIATLMLTGMGAFVSNLSIKINHVVTRSIYSNELPYFINFGCAESNFTGVDLSKEQSLLKVIYLDVSNLAYFGTMFRCCSNLIEVESSNWDTSKVTMMFSMFAECTSLLKADVSNWDTSNVVSMEWMFINCHRIETIDVSNWNTSNVTSMGNMFYNCNSLTSIGDVINWNTSNVNDMRNMFRECTSLTSLEVSNWDVSNVTNMGDMFRDCEKLTTLDVSRWDTSNVTDMDDMFRNCDLLALIEVSNWDVSNVTNMEYMFYNCDSITSLDVSRWDTSNVTNTRFMFSRCNLLTSLDLSNWNIDNVTDMSCMFYGCNSLTIIYLNNWNINDVTNMDDMFSDIDILNFISINNSDYESINKIIEVLPSEEESKPGILSIVGVDDLSRVNISSAQSKYWNVNVKPTGCVKKVWVGNELITRKIVNNNNIKRVWLGDNRLI